MTELINQYVEIWVLLLVDMGRVGEHTIQRLERGEIVGLIRVLQLIQVL